MLVQTIPLTAPQTLAAAPLTREAFAPFGEALSNPRPDSRPSNTAPPAIAAGALPHGAVSANQGTAIQYRGLASLRDLYAQAPSRAAATPRLTMFVCGARTPEPGVGGEVEGGGAGGGCVGVGVLERHPFTTQTFIPLSTSPSSSAVGDGAASQVRYLVIVAPSLAPSAADEGLPAPVEEADVAQSKGAGSSSDIWKPPGRGLPDLERLQAFVASGGQAVTYGAGTWHAPMVALGPAGSAVDFLVVQFANDVPVEDCQEVEVKVEGRSEGRRGEVPRILVRVPDTITGVVTHARL